jgi:hypothetical protein
MKFICEYKTTAIFNTNKTYKKLILHLDKNTTVSILYMHTVTAFV